MIKNYFITAWRILVKNKTHSFINIAGLSLGMAVAMLIGLWVYDEFFFDRNFKNYDRIGKVWQFVKFDNEKSAYDVTPIPMAEELRTKHPEFKAVSLSSFNKDFIISYGDKKFSETGSYTEPGFIEILSIKIIEGDRNGLNDINSIMISRSLAHKLFDKENAVNKIVKLNNKLPVKVTGIYEDLPRNSSFKELHFIAHWKLYAANDEYVKKALDQWDENSWQLYVQLNDGVDFKKASANIKNTRMKRDDPPAYKPEFFLHPMRKWHLYSDFQNGVNTGGLIQFIRLFSIIGIFVLLLACINFMNLSTARSEKRAKEVGIRKAIGSMRKQLIVQFFSESLLVVFLAFALSLLWVILLLPLFNQVADKNMAILWANPVFWGICLVFSLATGFVAGSYPAIYLSSFQPVKVLKGAFRVGRFAAIPRKVLVVVQFSVSVILIIGTVVVFRQIKFSKERPVGYSRSGLIEIIMSTPELRGHYNELRNDLLNTDAVNEMGESSGSITTQFGGTTDISWKGKRSDQHPLFMANTVSHDYGKTIGWSLLQGRDFSRDFPTDSAAIILNEAAVKLMGLQKPLGELVNCRGKNYKVVGITGDMIKESPFYPVSPSFFMLGYGDVNVITIKLDAHKSTKDALARVEAVFKKYNPASPFSFSFVDTDYGKKFFNEERIGKLASFFATLAIFISCLGLYGMASFMAEQRTKEIGVRKVLGASVFNLWGLLSKEFVLLIIISLIIAAPTAYYFMNNWLQTYTYRTDLSWWIFVTAASGALVITLLTVSFQTIKAAIANPVKSLRTE
ncbi:MAG: ABC transporter permease [Ferruginibacter sp.]